MKYFGLVLLCGMTYGQELTVPAPISDGWHWCHVWARTISCEDAPVLQAELPDQIPDKDKRHPAGDGCNSCDDNGFCTAMYCGKPINPEPVDVPAIQEIGSGFPCPFHLGEHCNEKLIWTCADKSRILLTAEDGTKHCLKF